MADIGALVQDLRDHKAHCETERDRTAHETSLIRANRAQWTEEIKTLSQVIDVLDALHDLVDSVADRVGDVEDRLADLAERVAEL